MFLIRTIYPSHSKDGMILTEDSTDGSLVSRPAPPFRPHFSFPRIRRPSLGTRPLDGYAENVDYVVDA